MVVSSVQSRARRGRGDGGSDDGSDSYKVSRKAFFYKKAKGRSASAASPKIMRLLRSLFLRPAIPSASREALVPERAYLRMYASVSVAVAVGLLIYPFWS